MGHPRDESGPVNLSKVTRMSFDLDSQNWGSVSSYSSSSVSSTGSGSSNYYPPPRPKKKKYAFNVASLDEVLTPPSGRKKRKPKKKPPPPRKFGGTYSYGRDSSDESDEEGDSNISKIDQKYARLHNTREHSSLEKQIRELNDRTMRIESHCLNSKDSMESLQKRTREILDLMKNQRQYLQKLQVEQMRRDMDEMANSQKIFQENKRVMDSLMQSVTEILNCERSQSRRNVKTKPNMGNLQHALSSVGNPNDFALGGMDNDVGDDCFSFDGF